MKKKNGKKLNILVTGVGGPAGVNITKLLMKHRLKFKVFAVDINSHSAGQFFSHQFFIGEKVKDEAKYLKWTKDFILKNKIDIVIPTVAEELVLMESLKKLIPKKVKILVSPHETLELCDEKDRLYSWMDLYYPEYMGRWTRLTEYPNFPGEEYFIKPVKGRGSRGCRLVSKEELLFLVTKKSEEVKDFIAMEVLPGREWTVDAYVNHDGTFAYVIPRLRLGLSGGISQIGSTDYNEEVIQTAKDIFTGMKCFGPVFVQLKEDINGVPKLVEVNPRASGGLTITALSGGDCIKAMIADLVNRKSLHDMKWKEITVTRYFEERIIK